MTAKKARIAFQGELGAYGHQACVEARPDHEPLPCATFEDAIEAVRGGQAELGMIAVDNSTYGRVADVHHLLPDSGLHIVDEAFVRVHVNLLAVPGASLADVKRVRSMSILHGQCRAFLKKHRLKTLAWHDNAAAARDVAALGDKSEAALASELAGKIYGLEVLARHIEDQDNNTTRFLIMSRDRTWPDADGEGIMTSFVFRVRNIPAALYKAMGGFATNGVNMVKLESYMLNGSFTATQFYADIEGHPEDPAVKRAMEELAYFTTHLEILGVYPMHPFRRAVR
jgi:prephenate dehydratase